MNYLLDTNACIAVLNGEPQRVRRKIEAAMDAGSKIHVSSIVLFELWYGVYKSAQVPQNSKRLESLFAGTASTLTFDEEDARITGRIRIELTRVGKPIGAYDMLIAAQALRHNYILITANVSEFSRVKHLHWEDWSKP